MIQQVCLTRDKSEFLPDFNQPMELVINLKHYKALKGTLKLLFDHKSLKLIKKARNQ